MAKTTIEIGNSAGMFSLIDSDRLRYTLVCVISALVIVIFGAFTIDSHGVVAISDSKQNVTFVYNLVNYGTFSSATEDVPNNPDHFREPFYPFYMAGLAWAFTDIDQVSYECFSEGPECAHIRVFMAYANLPLLIALVWIAVSTVRLFTTNWRVVYLITTLMLLANPFLYHQAFTELPAAVLLLIHSRYLYLTFRDWGAGRKQFRIALIAGISLALLTLTKAIFQFWILSLVVGMAGFFVFNFVRRKHFTRLSAGLTALLIFPSIILVGSWMARNYVQTGQFEIAGRDGIILALRAEFNDITLREYAAGFAHYSSPIMRPLLIQLFNEDDYLRLDRHQEGSFFQQIRNLNGRVVTHARVTYGMDGENMLNIDEELLKRAAMDFIREAPHKQLLLATMFAYRGSFVAPDPHHFQYIPGLGLIPQALISSLLYVPFIICALFFMPAMIWASVRALLQRHYALLMFFLPTWCGFACYAAFTHFIPRYTTPLVPIMVIAFALAVERFGPVLWDHVQRARLRVRRVLRLT